jgi:hypothetical protein
LISVKTIRLSVAASLGLQALQHLEQAAAAGFSADAKLQLAASPAGRIALHLVCAWRDHRFQWHWRGVTREMAGA